MKNCATVDCFNPRARNKRYCSDCIEERGTKARYEERGYPWFVFAPQKDDQRWFRPSRIDDPDYAGFVRPSQTMRTPHD